MLGLHCGQAQHRDGPGGGGAVSPERLTDQDEALVKRVDLEVEDSMVIKHQDRQEGSILRGRAQRSRVIDNNVLFGKEKFMILNFHHNIFSFHSTSFTTGRQTV